MGNNHDYSVILLSTIAVIGLLSLAVISRGEPRYERPEPDYVMGTCSEINC